MARGASWIRPAVGPLHARLLRSISSTPKLQRQIVERTTAVTSGTVVDVDGHELIVGEPLGAGMIAVTYAAATRSGARFAWKRARADQRLLRALLAAEVEAARQLPRLVAIDVAEVVGVDAPPRASLLKERYDGPTLQRVLSSLGELSRVQRHALEALLRRAAMLLVETGYHLDPSPKNICWERDRWVLLDAGQPLLAKPDLVELLSTASVDAYMRFFGPTIRAGPSAPSVMMRARCEPMFRDDIAFAYLDAWSLWVPLDEPAASGSATLLATVDEAIVEDEISFLMEPPRTGGGAHRLRVARDAPVDAPTRIAAAVAEFRAIHPRGAAIQIGEG